MINCAPHLPIHATIGTLQAFDVISGYLQGSPAASEQGGDNSLYCIYTCMHASDAPTWSGRGATCLAVVDVLSIEHHLDAVPSLIFITLPLCNILLTTPATTSAGLWERGKCSRAEQGQGQGQG